MKRSKIIIISGSLSVLIMVGAIFLSLKLMPQSLQVHFSGVATCDIPEAEIIEKVPNFKGVKLWERFLAYLYRWDQWYSEGPFTFKDKFSENFSVFHILLVASDSTYGKCDNEIIELFKRYIELGAPVDHYSDLGLTALHEAIIFKKTEFIRVLLNNGSDTSLKAKREGKKSNNMDAIQLADLMYKGDKDPERKVILYILRNNI